MDAMGREIESDIETHGRTSIRLWSVGSSIAWRVVAGAMLSFYFQMHSVMNGVGDRGERRM